MKVIPEIELPDDLEYAYRPDLRDWINDNLPGLRKINVQLYVKKNNYPTIAAIEFLGKEEKNKPNEKPRHDGREVQPEAICELIMKIIQFDVESKDDDTGKYRVQCVKNNGAGSITKAKHIDIPRSEGNNEIGFSMSPDQESMDLLPTALSYIERLQDMNLKMMSVVTEMIGPMQIQNTRLQDAVMKGFEKQEAIERMHILKEMHERENQKDLELGKIKSENWQKNFDKLIKHAERTGMTKQIMAGIVSKITGQQLVPPPENNNEPPPPPPPREREPDIKEQLQKEPLRTYCNGLYNSILELDQEDLLKERLGEDVYIPLHKLMNSESEDDAKENLKEVTELLQKANQLKIMTALQDTLNEKQQQMVMVIMNYAQKGEEQ